jgi:hypothetical protein
VGSPDQLHRLGFHHHLSCPRPAWCVLNSITLHFQTKVIMCISPFIWRVSLSSTNAVFRYPRSTHNVLEVSKADYDSCSGSRPLAMFQTGGDTIPLPAGGVTRYFICGVQGHCNRGMKLAVKVDQGRRCRIGRRRGPVTCSSAAWSAGGVASLVGLSLAAALMSVY